MEYDDSTRHHCRVDVIEGKSVFEPVLSAEAPMEEEDNEVADDDVEDFLKPS